MDTSSILRKLTLLPLSKLYGAATAMRNQFFDWGILKQTSFDVPVITVGNLAAGGTGKTPHTEYIVRLLRDRFNIGILSRGYKRRTKGFVLATPHSTPRDIGDESYQMFHKFGRKVMVAVCEKRVDGIRKMLEINPDLNLIILDDGFQHRYVKPKVSILLTEYHRPYYEDNLLPLGHLRESPKQALRADMVIVTKCPPQLKGLDYRLISKNLDLIPAQGLFFSRYVYDRPRPVFPSHVKQESIPALDKLSPDHEALILCGIGNPKPFIYYIRHFIPKTKAYVFQDHHDYSRKDMEYLEQHFNTLPKNKRLIFTTEKDAVRLINNPYFPHKLKPYIFFLPVYVVFDENSSGDLQESLIKMIKSQN